MSLMFPFVLGDGDQLRGIQHHRHSPWVLRPYGFNSPVDEVFRAFDNFANYADDVGRSERNQVSTGSGYKLTNNGLEVKLDVRGFKPEELDVKTVENCIVVKGNHEERQDDQGFISRSFVRRYVIPDTVKAENVNCSLSSDGFLILTAPLTTPQLENQRSVPITLSGQPAPSLESTDKGKVAANGPDQ